MKSGIINAVILVSVVVVLSVLAFYVRVGASAGESACDPSIGWPGRPSYNEWGRSGNHYPTAVAIARQLPAPGYLPRE